MEVIDPRTLLPLDKETIVSSVKKTHRLMIVHEAYSRGGIGSIITEEIMEEVFDSLDAPIKVLGGKNIPIPYSPPLEEVMIPQEKDIICQIRDWYS